MDNTHKQNIDFCRYNALVRAFSRAYKALLSEPSVEDFTSFVQVEMYSKIDALGEKENFSVEPFLNDVRAFNSGSASTFVPRRRDEHQRDPEMPRILIELVRAFKNRAPSLGEVKNESFWVAMFNAHAETLYIAALNVIRSYASAMARNTLAADIETAIGGSSNAD